MRNLIDFTSWQAVLSTLAGLVVFSLVAVGVRLLVMQSVQRRRERQNRQINERLKTLIAAYKTLGGSFTGNLAVDPSHLRELRLRAAAGEARPALAADMGAQASVDAEGSGSDRARRIRDAVEAALSDVILLGTQEQVQLAAHAAHDMVAGRKIETAELVASLRSFIREVLDLEAIPGTLSIPRQGPVRALASGGRAGGGGAAAGGSRGAAAGGQGGGGMAAGGVVGMGAARGSEDPAGAALTDNKLP